MALRGGVGFFSVDMSWLLDLVIEDDPVLFDILGLFLGILGPFILELRGVSIFHLLVLSATESGFSDEP